jgi:hypothetical protein
LVFSRFPGGSVQNATREPTLRAVSRTEHIIPKINTSKRGGQSHGKSFWGAFACEILQQSQKYSNKIPPASVKFKASIDAPVSLFSTKYISKSTTLKTIKIKS